MYMDFAKILDVIRQPRFVFAIAITTGLILFLPVSILQQIGLDQLINSYRSIIGLAFLGASILSSIHVITIVHSRIKDKGLQVAKRREQVRLLLETTPPEKHILYGFIKGATKTQRLDVDSGVVNGLIRKGMIYPTANRATSNVFHTSFHGPIFTCDHNITDWTWEYIKNNEDAFFPTGSSVYENSSEQNTITKQ